MDYKDIKINGVTKIEKVVAEFDIWTIQSMPFPKIKVKIKEDSKGRFKGQPNVSIKSLLDGSPDWVVGFGETVEEALEDTLTYFIKGIEGREELEENDFEWADPFDF